MASAAQSITLLVQSTTLLEEASFVFLEYLPHWLMEPQNGLGLALAAMAERP